jgi:predicted ATPase
MGVHTGEASEERSGLVGYEVHRAARIGAVAHGGQILLSSATAALVEGALPTHVTLHDLGLHRLKDLGRPEALFQLVAPGLRDEFPPLRSLDNPALPNNLPTSLSPFVGRLDEVAEIAQLLEVSRLVTLTGAGGSGKTRLALQVAAEVLDGSGEGVWLVELAPVNDAARVPGAVLDALRIRQETERDDLDALLHTLKDQRCLIILDNCEHLIDAAAKLADLVGRMCPKVTLLATSREPLGVDGEEILRVPSLSLPPADAETAAELAGFDAVDLFVSRARSHDKGFALADSTAPLVASVCRRLDGIPLAIELAAARLTSMSLKDLHDRLDQRFRLLTGGSRNALPRQQTLGAMVAWSYDLLNDAERAVLRRLTVFVDGFTLDAVEAVCAIGTVDAFDLPDLLGSLVNKSLVTTERVDDLLRYRLLETIRQYVAEQLLQIDGEAAALETRRMHAEHFAALCEQAMPNLYGADQVAWVWRLDAERGNILAALSYFAEAPDGEETALRLGWAGSYFFSIRRFCEPRALLQSVLDRDPVVSNHARAGGLMSVEILGDYTPSGGEAAAFRQASHDRLSRVLELVTESDDDLILLTWGLIYLSFNAKDRGDVRGALEGGDQAVDAARRTGEPELIGWAQWAVGHIRDEAKERREAFVLALEQFRRAKTTAGLAATLYGLASTALRESDVESSRTFALEAMETAGLVGWDEAQCGLYELLGIVESIRGDFDAATVHCHRGMTSRRRLGWQPYSSTFLVLVLSCCAAASGDFERAARLFGAYESLEDQLPENHAHWSSLELELRDGQVAALRGALGDDVFDRDRTAGSRLTFDQIVNLALGRSSSTQ